MGNVGAHYYDWLTNPDSAREYSYTTDDGNMAVAIRDPHVIYTLEVDVQQIAIGPPGSPPNVPDSAVYRIYRSLDNGQTKELRFTGELGPACWSTLQVKLLLPRSPQADPRRIGLLTACAQNPSDARGYGVQIYSSYDGAKTFFARGSD
jgi:hypothetical protein